LSYVDENRTVRVYPIYCAGSKADNILFSSKAGLNAAKTGAALLRPSDLTYLLFVLYGFVIPIIQ
jgi:hypothetical protein